MALWLRRKFRLPSEERWGPIFLAVCSVILLAHALFTRDLFFYRDFWQTVYPNLKWGISTIQAGGLPLWNPYLCSGYPLFACMIYGFAYPPVIILVLLPFALAIKLYILVHILWAGWGTYFLCRYLKISPGAACLAGVIYMLSGPLVSGVNNIAYLITPSWLPWVLLGYIRWHSEHKGLAWVIMAVALMILSGEMQTCYNVGLILVWFGGVHLTRTGLAAQLAKSAGALLVIFGVAFLAAAVQIFPALELAKFSERLGGVTSSQAGWFSLYWEDLWRFLVPFIYGNPTVAWYGSAAHNHAPFESSLYVGLLTLPLAVTGACRRPFSRLQCFCVAGFLFFLLTALAQQLPFYRFLWNWLPFWNFFRYSEKLILPALFFAAILAALGAEHLTTLSKKGLWRWLAISLVGLLVLIVAALYFAPGMPSEQALMLWRRQEYRHTLFTWLATTLVVGSAVAIFYGRPHLVLSLLCLAVSADLIYHNRQVLPTAPESFYHSPCPEMLAPYQGNLQYRVAVWEAEAKSSVRTASFADYARTCNHYQQGAGHLTMLQRVRRDWGLMPASLQRYGWLRYASKQNENLAARMSVARKIGTNSYDIPLARPRCSLVYQVAEMDDVPNALSLMGVMDVGTAVTLKQDGQVPCIPTPLAANSQDRVTIEPEQFPTKVVVKTDTVQPAYLLLTDVYYPGWNAYVDGKATPIYLADLAFRLIYLPAGQHTVIFQYVPLTFYLGLILSLVCWALLLGKSLLLV